MAKKYNRDLILNGNMFLAIMSLAIPVVINSFLQTMYNLTDTYWLGHIGKQELAAINLVTPVQNIVINFGTGITVAGSVLVAQYIGAALYEEAKKMASQIYVCALLFSVVCALACFFSAGGIVSWLGAETEIYSYGKIYLQIVILDMPLLFTINIFTAINQAQGDTVRPMLLNFVGIVLNMILDPLFMVVFKWGIAGAALATLISKVPPTVIALISLLNPNKQVHITLKGFHFDREKLKDVIKIGLPTAIGGSTMQFGFLLMSKSVFVYGEDAMAAYGIGNKVNSLITLPTNGIGSAVATIVGQNMGAGQINRAQKGYRISRNISVAFLFIGGRILSLPVVATAIVGIFSEDAAVISMAADFLAIMAFWCFTNGVYNSTTGLFNGTGHTEVTMIVDATRLWVFRFLTLFVCERVLHMGVRSVWYSVVVSNGISAVILYIVYRTGLWRKSKINVNKANVN